MKDQQNILNQLNSTFYPKKILSDFFNYKLTEAYLGFLTIIDHLFNSFLMKLELNESLIINKNNIMEKLQIDFIEKKGKFYGSTVCSAIKEAENNKNLLDDDNF